MPLEFLGLPRTTVAFIGDSHVGPYDGLVFRAEDDNLIASRSEYIYYLQAAEFTQPGGMLAPAVTRALAGRHLVGPRPRGQGASFLHPIETTRNGLRVVEDLDVTRDGATTAVVVVCGEIDARNILGQFKPTTDIVLDRPAPALERLGGPAIERHVTEAEFRSFLERQFRPLFAGLELLARRGMRRLFLHSIPPPTVDEAAAAGVLGFPRPASQRYKIALLINSHFRSRTSELGIGFLDLWPHVTDEAGLLRDEFYLDGLHLNTKAARIGVQLVYDACSTPALGAPIP